MVSPAGCRLRGRICARLAGLLAVALLAAMVATSAQASVTILYVGTSNCSDTGAGTASQPFCTIAKAAAVAVAGQSVQVAAGSYGGGASVAHSGSTGAPIVFSPAPGAAVTISGGSSGFVVPSRSYVTISGFAVTGTTSYGIKVTSSTNITVADNTVTYAGKPVSGQTAPGIYLSGVSNSTVTHNTADHNSDTGIYLTGGTTNTTVDHNEASFNAEVYQRNANGINVVSAGNFVIANVLHDNEDSGIQFYPGGNNNLAADNVSYNNGDHGIDDLNVTGGRLIGNTIYHNCTSGINVEGTSGNYLVENNIAVDNGVYPAYKGISCDRRAGNIGIWDSAPSSTTVDHNIVWLSMPGKIYVFGSSYDSLAAMQKATGQEQHGQQADPKFVDPANFALALQDTSPAIDIADSAASGEQSTDVLGNPRVDDPGVPNTGSGPRGYDDAGAYEFQPTVTPVPPTAQLAVAPASGTAPLAVTADATGSTDPQGQALTYSFDFGDGSPVLGPQPGTTATHSYATAGSYTATVTVTDTAGLTGTASQSVSVSAQAPVDYVSQIATNYSTRTHTSSYVTVWRSAGVQAGDVVIVTLALTGTTAGPVSATDDAGNSYAVASTVSDAAGNWLVVLYGVARGPLSVNDRITATFPSATTYRMTADEASGLSTLDQSASAAGTAATFDSGSTATTTSPREFVFGAVALYAGTTPGWASDWQSVTSYAVGSNYLGRAYQVANTTEPFRATGTGSGYWLATTVTLR